VEPEFKTVEISIKFLGNDYKDTREIYVQRVNFDWYFNNRPTLVQQIVAVVNELEFLPPTVPPGSWQEVK
jgi:hypothetical protein